MNAIIKLPVPTVSNERLIAAGVHDANRVWRAGRDRYIANVLEIARHVHQVWKACEASKISFRSLFREDAEVAFEFGRDLANKFLAIGKNPALVGGETSHQLPDNYTTLAKLAQIPAPKLKRLIDTGTITPSMRRAEVAVLVNDVQPMTAKKTTSTVQSRACVEDAIYSLLSCTLKNLPREERLQKIINFVRACGAEEILKSPPPSSASQVAP